MNVRKGPVVVIGSINMDLVCRTPRMPAAGETILGSGLATIPGGKGANQAVAAAKLGGDVHFVGRVGDDDFGNRLLTGLRQHRVDVRHVTVTEGLASGCAVILVDRKGENSIVVVPGANHRVTPEDIDRAAGLITRASVVVLQLELPLDTVQHAIATCQRLGVYTILDPAPVPPKGLPRAMFEVDVLTPNQHEAEAILPRGDMGRMRRTKRVDAKQIGGELLSRGPRAVVLKLSRKGAVLVARASRDSTAGARRAASADDVHVQQVAGHKVNIVDTTAAGDAFTGALAVAIAEGKGLAEATRFANAAGAICCETFGAQPSLPTREAVDKLLG
jgi:ribokinase